MELQQVIVYVIVLLCIVQAVTRTLRYFKRIRRNGHPCEGCSSACSLKPMHAKPPCCCGKTQKKQKKSAKRLQV